MLSFLSKHINLIVWNKPRAQTNIPWFCRKQSILYRTSHSVLSCCPTCETRRRPPSKTEEEWTRLAFYCLVSACICCRLHCSVYPQLDHWIRKLHPVYQKLLIYTYYCVYVALRYWVGIFHIGLNARVGYLTKIESNIRTDIRKTRRDAEPLHCMLIRILSKRSHVWKPDD